MIRGDDDGLIGVSMRLNRVRRDLMQIQQSLVEKRTLDTKALHSKCQSISENIEASSHILNNIRQFQTIPPTYSPLPGEPGYMNIKKRPLRETIPLSCDSEVVIREKTNESMCKDCSTCPCSLKMSLYPEYKLIDVQRAKKINL